VPAEEAVVPVRDRILSRLGTGDDMEANLSSFAAEMSDTAYLLQNATARSLIIIDELGRRTCKYSFIDARVLASDPGLMVPVFPNPLALDHEHCRPR
jgi:hypothetical protein